MADRRDYFYRMLLAEDELDAGFDTLEQADRKLISDLNLTGIVGELGAVQQHSGTPNLTVDITGPVPIYDKLGQRIFIPSLQTKDMSVDDGSVSTAVAGGGNEKWVSLFAVFARALSDPRVDGNSNTVFFVRAESFTLSVVQGAEAVIPTAVRPNLSGTNILLADVRLINGQTQILDADVFTDRRETLITYPRGGGPFVQKTSILGAIVKIENDMQSSSGGDDGASRVGAATSGGFSAGSVRDQLDLIGPSGTPTFTGARTYQGRIIPSGNGGIIGSRSTTLSDANQTIDIKNDHYRVAAPTANRTYTLRSSTSPVPAEGDKISVTRGATGAFTMLFQREDATAIVTFGDSWTSATFLFTGGVWTLFHVSTLGGAGFALGAGA